MPVRPSMQMCMQAIFGCCGMVVLGFLILVRIFLFVSADVFIFIPLATKSLKTFFVSRWFCRVHRVMKLQQLLVWQSG